MRSRGRLATWKPTGPEGADPCRENDSIGCYVIHYEQYRSKAVSTQRQVDALQLASIRRSVVLAAPLHPKHSPIWRGKKRTRIWDTTAVGMGVCHNFWRSYNPMECSSGTRMDCGSVQIWCVVWLWRLATEEPVSMTYRTNLRGGEDVFLMTSRT